jgi:L-aspartate oxidase
VHGANRLASNSLLEGLVFGLRAGHAMRAIHAAGAGAVLEWPATFASELIDASASAAAPCASASTKAPATWTTAAVRELMWKSVGIFRDGAGLRDAVCQLDAGSRWLLAQPAPRTVDDVRLASVLTVGRLMARAALRRQESRGGHYRDDFPERDDVRWRKHLAETRNHSHHG